MNGQGTGPLGTKTPPEELAQLIRSMRQEIVQLQMNVRTLSGDLAGLHGAYDYLEDFVRQTMIPVLDLVKPEGCDNVWHNWCIGLDVRDEMLILSSLKDVVLLNWSDTKRQPEAIAKVDEVEGGKWIAYVIVAPESPLKEEWHLATRISDDKGTLIRDVIIAKMKASKTRHLAAGAYTPAMLGKAPALAVVE